MRCSRTAYFSVTSFWQKLSQKAAEPIGAPTQRTPSGQRSTDLHGQFERPGSYLLAHFIKSTEVHMSTAKVPSGAEECVLQAQKHLREALRLDPDDKEAGQTIKKVTSRR